MFQRRLNSLKSTRRSKPRFETLEDRFAPAVDLSVTSLVSDMNPVQGATVTYNVTVVNHGTDAAAGVTVRDQVPDIFGIPANISEAGTVPSGTNDVEWTGLTIAPGASLQLTYDVATGTNSTLIAPSAALGANAWNRPTSTSNVATFQGWDVFTSPGGPNAPATLTGPNFGGVAGNSWPAINSGGVANAFDSGAPASGSFLTSTGNIYSPSSVLKPRIVVPNNLDGTPGDNASGWTTVLLQVRSLGAIVDHESVRLNGSVAPVDYALVSSGSGLGVTQTWAFLFQVAGNADVYTLDLSAGGTSLSFDKASVDTIWKPDATSQSAAYGFALPLLYKDSVQVTAGSQTATASANVVIGTTLPVITSNGGTSSAAINVPENTTAVTTVAATDPEAPSLQTLTYSISEGGDAALFQISATGAVSFIAAPDFETPADVGSDNVYNITVNVNDGRGGTDSQSLAITVTPVQTPSTLSVTSVASDLNPVQGSTVTYTVTVTNNGSTAVTGAKVTDQVPDIFGTPTNISGTGTVPSGTNDVEWTGLTIAPGASLQLTYDVATGTNSTLIAPSTALGANAWNRPTSTSNVATFQGWDVFTSPGGPNAPATLTGPNFGGVTGNSWPAVNSDGVANAFDSASATSGSFLTSSGNIYSPAGILKPRIVVPNNLDGVAGNNASGWTTILLQVRSLGAVLDNESVRLNGAILPVDYALVSAGTGMGVTQTWAFLFQVAGNADVYTLDFSAGGSSLSFDKVAVDTIWKSDATSQSAAYGFALPLLYKDNVQVTAGSQTATASANVVIGTTLPIITSNGGTASAAINVAENTTTVTTVAATDPEAPSLQSLTYSIAEGGDASVFQINAATGAVSFIAAPDFETPADAGSDNVYNITVNVSDGRGGTDSQSLAVTVTNVAESGAPTVTGIAPFVGPTVGFTIVITGTGFTGATKVTFGTIDVVAPHFTVDSDTKITATAPPGTGTVNVTVTTTATSVPSALTPGIDQITYSVPQVLSVTPNANNASLAGTQRSRVASMVVTFDQPVTLETGAVTLALHTKSVIYGGVAQASGYGSLPTSINVAATDAKTYVVTFVGNTDDGPDGFHSIKDGVYDLTIDGSKVHAVGASAVKMAGNSTTTFHRLAGDTNAPSTPAGGTPGADFEALVNSGDNLAFRGAFNNAATYKAYFDFNGDGTINSGDNLQFRNRFNKALAWKV